MGFAPKLSELSSKFLLLLLTFTQTGQPPSLPLPLPEESDPKFYGFNKAGPRKSFNFKFNTKTFNVSANISKLLKVTAAANSLTRVRVSE